MDALSAKVYSLQEKLSTQKHRIEALYEKMQKVTCEIEMLVCGLEECSIELGDDEKKKKKDGEDGLCIPPVSIIRNYPHPWFVLTSRRIAARAVSSLHI